VRARDGVSDALGARVTVHVGSDSQERIVRTAHSYLSASEPAVTFGLRSDAPIDSVRVTWHGGESRVWLGLEADQTYRLHPDGPPARVNPARSASRAGLSG
jgi:hypothetical protein